MASDAVTLETQGNGCSAHTVDLLSDVVRTPSKYDKHVGLSPRYHPISACSLTAGPVQ
jgi:hypothetical protein